MNNVLTLLERYAPGRRLRILAVASIGGFAGALVVAMANAAAASEKSLASPKLGFFSLLVLAVMYFSQRVAARSIVAAFEDVQRGMRDDLAAGLRRAPLRVVEPLESKISQASTELASFSNTIEHWVSGVQHLAFLVSATFIVANISFKALGVWLVAFGAFGLHLRPRLVRLESEGMALGMASGKFGERVEQLLDGFTQVKLDGQVGGGITDDILEAAEKLHAQQRSMQGVAIGTFTGGILLLNLLIWGPAAFADPAGIGLGPVAGFEMISFVEISLGPLFGLAQALPEWIRAEAAAGGIRDVLNKLATEEGTDEGDFVAPNFEKIELRRAFFTYAGEGSEFKVGPIDLALRRGELTLITGDNGSGKTTLMKMLLGLYELDGGHLCIDGVDVCQSNRARYRNLFTAIFSHQHLFSRLHGLSDSVSLAQVDALLERFGLQEIVCYEGGGFDRIDLSTGQKMRLAMVVALLEDRPICVFDEWTANQDPEMTWYYYDVLLPELIAAGKTVIAVSHDERFFDRADNFIAMVNGRIVQQRWRGKERSSNEVHSM